MKRINRVRASFYNEYSNSALNARPYSLTQPNAPKIPACRRTSGDRRRIRFRIHGATWNLRGLAIQGFRLALHVFEVLVRDLELCREPGTESIQRAARPGLPPKDAPILAAAIEARCGLLVTGDRTHFNAFYGRQIEGTVVATPVEALRILIGTKLTM